MSVNSRKCLVALAKSDSKSLNVHVKLWFCNINILRVVSAACVNDLNPGC